MYAKKNWGGGGGGGGGFSPLAPPYLHPCNVHTSITTSTAVLPYMHVCTMYILLSRLLYSPTFMCVQCTYFYHDCCTPLHSCVYNVRTSITTAVLLYMHVCTPLHACVYNILLSRLLYSPTCTNTGSWLPLVMLVVGVVKIVVSVVLLVAVGFQVGLQDSKLP